MNIPKQALVSLFCSLTLGACTNIPPGAYDDRGNPERLLIPTSEVVTIDLKDSNYAEHLSDALKENSPTRAIVSCPLDDTACKKATQLLSANKIAMENVGRGSTVTLVYNSAVVQACDNSYTDNMQNENNLNYDAFGCSISSNMANMVTDKRQFTNPNLLDFYSGEKAASVYKDYVNPAPAAASSNSSGGGGSSGSLLPTSSQ